MRSRQRQDTTWGLPTLELILMLHLGTQGATRDAQGVHQVRTLLWQTLPETFSEAFPLKAVWPSTLTSWAHSCLGPNPSTWSQFPPWNKLCSVSSSVLTQQRHTGTVPFPRKAHLAPTLPLSTWQAPTLSRSWSEGLSPSCCPRAWARHSRRGERNHLLISLHLSP